MTVGSQVKQNLALKSKWVHDLLNGTETILIKQENLFQVRLTGEEVLRELRAKNFFNVSEVEFEKIQADLTSFSLETENRDTKAMYANYAVKLEAALQQLQLYLLH